MLVILDIPLLALKTAQCRLQHTLGLNQARSIGPLAAGLLLTLLVVAFALVASRLAGLGVDKTNDTTGGIVSATQVFVWAEFFRLIGSAPRFRPFRHSINEREQGRLVFWFDDCVWKGIRMSAMTTCKVYSVKPGEGIGQQRTLSSTNFLPFLPWPPAFRGTGFESVRAMLYQSMDEVVRWRERERQDGSKVGLGRVLARRSVEQSCLINFKNVHNR